MKYEVRRQALSSGLLIGVFLTVLVVFFQFYRTGNAKGIEVALLLMAAVSVSIMLFAPIEYWILFHIDINSGQGNMLFLLPKKENVILGAKIFVALLRTVILYALCFTVVLHCERLAVENYDFATGYTGKIISTIIEMVQSANATLSPVIGVWLYILVEVLFFSNLGLFVMAVPLPMEKFRGTLRFCGYIVAFALIVFVEMKISDLLLFITSSQTVVDVFEIVYLIGVNLALFFGTAKLLDKKVSI